LQLLGQFIEQREHLTGAAAAAVDNEDDSEMNLHLQNVRRALGSQKK
jgi:hypothetical protein